MPEHIPVLLSETLTLLQPERGGVFIDATIGLGGHSEALIQAAEEAKKPLRLIGIDQDPYALQMAEERLGNKAEYMQGNFAELAVLKKQNIASDVDAILMDIGLSSYQLDTPDRGFSFQANGPLDMRMDPGGTITAASIVNTWPEFKLVNLFFKCGEEKFSRKIAGKIVERRNKKHFEETSDLAELIVEQYPIALRNKKPHPATKVFQALRIEVNRELEVLPQGIKAALNLLGPGGRLAIISFHSLEDRIVKTAFREAVAEGGFALLTKKPVIASREEELANPRSRSAKMRGIEKLP
jgi:16S rRNA (cytosine1402-N4)-methyltransferase